MIIKNISRASLPWTIKQIHKMYKNNTADFNMSIQRNGDIWDVKRKSLFIHSLIMNFPIPPVYTKTEESTINDKTVKTYQFLDGKQRLTSTFQFLNDEYALENVPFVETDEGDIDINGLKFSELKDKYEEIADEITNRTLNVYRLDDIDDETTEEIFFRLNNGVALTSFELTRAKATGKVMNFISDIANKPFFAEKLPLTEKARNRYTDQEIILQMIAIFSDEEYSFASKDLQNYAMNLKHSGVTKEAKENIIKATEYMNEVFTIEEEKSRKRMFKKVHIPMMMLSAKLAVENDITTEQYKEWIIKFFEENKASGTRYNNAARSGSAKEDNVLLRIDIMTNHFKNNFDIVDEVETNDNIEVEINGVADAV